MPRCRRTTSPRAERQEWTRWTPSGNYGRALARLVDPDRFPEVAKLFASTLFEAPTRAAVENPEGNDFTIGLELIPDGVAAAVERAGG